MQLKKFTFKNGSLSVTYFHQEDENNNGIVNTDTTTRKRTHHPHADLTRQIAKLKTFVPLAEIEVTGAKLSGKEDARGVAISFTTSDFEATGKKQFYTDRPELQQVTEELETELFAYLDGKTGELDLFSNTDEKSEPGE